MPIPGFKIFLRPVLEALNEHNELAMPRTSLMPIIKEKMNLTEDECSEKLDSGGNRLHNRIGWALTYLKKSGLIDFPRRAVAQITDQGRTFLTAHQGPIEPKDLEIFPEYLKFKEGNIRDDKLEAIPEKNLEEIDPEEKINLGYKEIKNALIDDLLEKLVGIDPTQFEKLVLDLIRKLGYGAPSDRLEHTGGSGDFGIDGVVHLDRLGLDKIYVQAKRYSPDNKINSKQIQEFFGALKGHHATKGIFLTTSSYQPSALEYAKSVSDTLVLIDGRKIAELMIEAEIGVSAKRKIIIPEIDNDYFE
jgi:restriction system protein